MGGIWTVAFKAVQGFVIIRSSTHHTLISPIAPFISVTPFFLYLLVLYRKLFSNPQRSNISCCFIPISLPAAVSVCTQHTEVHIEPLRAIGRLEEVYFQFRVKDRLLLGE